jgi:hypothetical protein
MRATGLASPVEEARATGRAERLSRISGRRKKKISYNIWLSGLYRNRVLAMDIAIVFKWFAKESLFAAQLTHEQPQHETWIRLAVMWASAAAQCRHEEAGAIGENAA